MGLIGADGKPAVQKIDGFSLILNRLSKIKAWRAGINMKGLSFDDQQLLNEICNNQIHNEKELLKEDLKEYRNYIEQSKKTDNIN